MFSCMMQKKGASEYNAPFFRVIRAGMSPDRGLYFKAFLRALAAASLAASTALSPAFLTASLAASAPALIASVAWGATLEALSAALSMRSLALSVEKAVITMRDTMGMDFGDIAEELGITEANTRMILSRARKTVREIYLSSKK